MINAISVPLLGYSGLPPSSMHAFTGISIFREFLIDGGYYIEEGMQMLPDTLASIIKQNKGTILYKTLATRITCKNRSVAGVLLDNNIFYQSKYVISAGDVTQTFRKLLGERIIGRMMVDKLKKMSPSLSAFILYIGLDDEFQESYPLGTNIWFLQNYDLDKIHRQLGQSNFVDSGLFTVRVSPNKRTMLAFMNAPFKKKVFWEHNKKRIAEHFLDRIEAIYPTVKKHIVYFDAATPYTLYRYTLNYKGSAFGWEYTPAQLFDPELSYNSPVKGLFLVGHWSTQALGISGVAYLGYNTAKRIVRRETV